MEAFLLSKWKGIDVSSHQGDVNFKAVKKAGYSFVIIKAGQGTRPMKTFREKYLPGVLDAGLEWGAYWWSDATSERSARNEALAFIDELSDLKPTFPVFMDQEYDSPVGKLDRESNRKLRSRLIDTFCGTLENYGFYAGIYASTDWFNNWVDDSMIRNYTHWVAQYSSKCTYPRDCGIWQHKVSGANEVPGCALPVDLNIAYLWYPNIIKKGCFNGWCRNDV